KTILSFKKEIFMLDETETKTTLNGPRQVLPGRLEIVMVDPADETWRKDMCRRASEARRLKRLSRSGEQFLHRDVKVGFRCDNSNSREFIWLEVVEANKGILTAIVANYPLFVSGLRYGQKVKVHVKQVCEVMELENETQDSSGP